MARPQNVIKTVFKKIGLPEDLSNRLDSDLFSEFEGRIPHGAQQKFWTKLLSDHYARMDAQTALNSTATTTESASDHE